MDVLKKESINFAWPVTSVNREDFRGFMEWYECYEEILLKNKIAIWGAGIRGTEFSIFFEKKMYYNFFFVDSNGEKWDGNINGYEIVSPQKVFERMQEENIKILISVENNAAIRLFLEGQGYCLGKDFYIIKTDLYDKYVEEFRRKNKNIVLFMGDCEFSTISLYDTDMNNLGEMLKNKLDPANCKILAMHGMGLRSHYHIFKAQIEKNMCPEKLIVMINLDTLTGKQHLLPRSQHEELLLRIREELGGEEKEFDSYLEEVHERTCNIQVEFLTNRSEKKNISDEIKAKNYFKLNYMYKLNVETEGIKYLVRIIELAWVHNCEVITFIPPVNYRYAKAILGDVFLDRYSENVRLLKEIVEQKGCRFLDYSYILSENEFAERNTPDETANEKGRSIICDLLCDALKEEVQE